MLAKNGFLDLEEVMDIPGFPGTDHTREHTPFLVYGKSIREDVNLGTRESFADIAATILDIFNVENNTDGTSMKEYILKK